MARRNLDGFSASGKRGLSGPPLLLVGTHGGPLGFRAVQMKPAKETPMSAAEDTATISIAPPGREPLQLPWEKLSAPAVHPWIAAFVGVLAFAIVGGCAALVFLKARLDGLAATTTVTARQATDLTVKVADLAE